MHDTGFALLICNGEMASPETARQLAGAAERIVCADGGANAARQLGIVPEVVIGDFDSITAETRQEFAARGVRMERITGQDDTDLEKAIRFLRAEGVKQLVLLGITGKRLDHTLGNFSILRRYAAELQIVLFDPHYRIDLLASGGRFRTRPGDRISVVPLPAATAVSYKGLRYPMNAEDLSFGLREGTCNEAVSDSIELSFEHGVVLLFRDLHPDLCMQPFST